MKYRQLFASGLTAVVLAAAPLLAAGGDDGFVRKAAEGGTAEVQMAQLAQSKASSQAVKDLAQMIYADHSKANDKLKPIVSKDNLTWPTGLSSKHQAEYNRLQGLSGAEFDREYVAAQVKDHKQDISDFQHEAEHGTNPEVKAWAAENLPALQEHLKMAQSAQSSIHQQ